MCGSRGGAGRGIDMLEDMGAVRKTDSSQDSKTSQASLKDDKAPSKTVSKKQTKKTTKNKTSKSAVGSNPLNKSSTGLEIRRI
jgi:hypothetical protein